MKILWLAVFMAGLCLPVVAEAGSRRGADSAQHEEIAAFCKGKKRPTAGEQWNDLAADASVMAFAAGEYVLDRGADVTLTIYEGGLFWVNLGKRGASVFGSDGDDLIKARIVGGCSREQLSEVLRRNQLLDIAKDIVPEDAALRAAYEAAPQDDTAKDVQ